MLKDNYFLIFTGDDNDTGLTQAVYRLFTDQLGKWPQLVSAYKLLQQTRERDIQCNGFKVRLRYNALRAGSTMAGVDKKSIAARPCFLCLDNLPENQEGILYRNNYLILCNPMPAFEHHVTIVSVEHRPQTIEGTGDTLFQLVDDFGSGWTILYNGPECGASAPDHNHFQAIPSGLLPIENEIEKSVTRNAGEPDHVSPYKIDKLGREVIFLNGRDKQYLQSVFKRMIDTLKAEEKLDREPMVNVAATKKDNSFHVFIFPRSKHRPQAYFWTDDSRIVVSPAVIEMSGIIMTPVERDFERLTGADIENIYREVSLKTKTTALF